MVSGHWYIDFLFPICQFSNGWTSLYVYHKVRTLEEPRIFSLSPTLLVLLWTEWLMQYPSTRQTLIQGNSSTVASVPNFRRITGFVDEMKIRYRNSKLRDFFCCLLHKLVWSQNVLRNVRLCGINLRSDVSISVMNALILAKYSMVLVSVLWWMSSENRPLSLEYQSGTLPSRPLQRVLCITRLLHRFVHRACFRFHHCSLFFLRWICNFITKNG